MRAAATPPNARLISPTREAPGDPRCMAANIADCASTAIASAAAGDTPKCARTACAVLCVLGSGRARQRNVSVKDDVGKVTTKVSKEGDGAKCERTAGVWRV